MPIRYIILTITFFPVVFLVGISYFMIGLPRELGIPLLVITVFGYIPLFLNFADKYYGPITGLDFINVYKKAEKGKRFYQEILGEYYLYGTYTEQDFEKGFIWTKKAAENGITQAKVTLAILYYEGVGTEANHEKSIFWYKEAAKKGNKEAKGILEILKTEQIARRNFGTPPSSRNPSA